MKIPKDYLAENTTPESRKRGREIFYRQFIRPLKTKTGYHLIVHGTGDYEVDIRFENEKVTAECTCPYSGEGKCKHIAAVVLAVQDGQIDRNPSGFKTGLSDLERSNDADFLVKYYDTAPQRAKEEFKRDDLVTNQSLRMRFLQFLRKM